MTTESPGNHSERRMGVQVIARAAEICRELATATDGLTTAELVERVGLSRPTVYRILRALMDEDFVRQVEPGRYAVGPAFLVIGGSTYGGLRHDMRPFMKDLSSELGGGGSSCIRRIPTSIRSGPSKGKAPVASKGSNGSEMGASPIR